MTIIVTGGRHIDDFDLVSICIKNSSGESNIDKILVGDCPTGVDNLTIRFAKSNNIPHVVFVADWKTYGKSAGPIRNKEMMQAASFIEDKIVVAIWDGKSKGTKDAITKARQLKLDVKIYLV